MADVLAPDAPDDTKVKPKPDSGPNWDRIYSAVGLPSKDKLAADDDKIASLETKAPVLTPMPPKEPQTDPLQVFGQPAFWIAAIGSLLTRSHLTAAIQSAGAVVNSTKQQDQAITQRHYDEWKVNTENALKMAKYEQDAYKAALAKKTTDVRESEAELRAVATSAKNAGLLKALDEEGMAGAARYVEAHGKGIHSIEDGARGFSEHIDAQRQIVEGLASDDPSKQADALDLYAEQLEGAQKGKGSTATSRMSTMTVGVRLKAIAEALRSGDPQRVAAAQAEAGQMPELGPGVLKPPKAPKSEATSWQILTNPEDSQQFRTRTGPDGKPEYQDMAGNKIDPPKGAEHLGGPVKPKTEETKWEILTDPTTNEQYRARTGPDGKPEYQNMAGDVIEPPHGAARIASTAAEGSVGQERKTRFDELKRAQQASGAYTDDTSVYDKVDAQIKATKENHIPPATAKTIVDQAIAGDYTGLIGWGRSPGMRTDLENALTAELSARHLTGADLARLKANYAAYSQGVKSFAAGGAMEKPTRSLSVAVDHLDLLQQTAEALAQHDTKSLNYLQNMLSTQFGMTGPPTFDALKGIVSAEIEKAVTGGQGAVADREDLKESLNKSLSPDTLASVISGYEGLMGGQLNGIRATYKRLQRIEGQTGEDFDQEYLTPRAREILTRGKTTSGPPHPTPPDAIANIPNLQWSPSKLQFRDPATGDIYDTDGNKVQ